MLLTVVFEKTLESPLDCKETKPVHPKGNQSWICTGRTDVEAPILQPPDVKSWLLRKDPDAGKDWRQEEHGMTEDEMVGWHPWPDGHEFEQTLGVGDGQGSLACCGPWVERVRHVWVTEQQQTIENLVCHHSQLQSIEIICFYLSAFPWLPHTINICVFHVHLWVLKFWLAGTLKDPDCTQRLAVWSNSHIILSPSIPSWHSASKLNVHL